MRKVRRAARSAAPAATENSATTSSVVEAPSPPLDAGAEGSSGFRQRMIAELDRRFEGLRIPASSEARAALRAALEANGQQQPVLVARDAATGMVILLDGFKRCDVLAALGATTVWVREIDHDPVDSLVAILAANARQLGTHEIEQAWVVVALKALGLEQVDIARIVSRSPSWVCRRLQLIERLIPSVIADVRTGLLAPRSAQELAHLPRGNQGAVARAIVRHKLTSRQVTRLVQVWRLSRPERRDALLDDPLAHLTEDRSGRRAKADPRLSAPGNELRRQLLLAMEAIHRLGDLVGDAPTKALLLADAPILAPWSRPQVAKGLAVLAELEQELCGAVRAFESSRVLQSSNSLPEKSDA